MNVLLNFLGLGYFFSNNEKVKKQEVNNLDNLEEMKFAQLESYMNGDDNGGIANLSLYI